MKDNNGLIIKIVVVITYLLMIILNGLANALPINGITTGEVSNMYFDLFAPSTITFSIWGLIYLLLAGYTLYQLGLFQADKGTGRESLFQKIGIYFSISSVANGLWILTWHYDVIWLSLLFMLVILACLYMIATIIHGEKLSFKEKGFIKVPFGIYFGWITVATIANIVTFLVSVGWTGIASQFWTVILLIIALVIGISWLRKFKNFAYGLVLIWAYTGILIKHVDPAEYGGQYPAIIAMAIIGIIITILSELYFVYPKLKKVA
ncbi:MAG: tryptophan-rich sensory protein [Bacillota bacterium]